jgi:serine/threonine protein phosphatase PrpC
MLKNKLKDFQKINPNLKDNLTNNIKYQTIKKIGNIDNAKIPEKVPKKNLPELKLMKLKSRLEYDTENDYRGKSINNINIQQLNVKTNLPKKKKSRSLMKKNELVFPKINNNNNNFNDVDIFDKKFPMLNTNNNGNINNLNNLNTLNKKKNQKFGLHSGSNILQTGLLKNDKKKDIDGDKSNNRLYPKNETINIQKIKTKIPKCTPNNNIKTIQDKKLKSIKKENSNLLNENVLPNSLLHPIPGISSASNNYLFQNRSLLPSNNIQKLSTHNPPPNPTSPFSTLPTNTPPKPESQLSSAASSIANELKQMEYMKELLQSLLGSPLGLSSLSDLTNQTPVELSPEIFRNPCKNFEISITSNINTFDGNNIIKSYAFNSSQGKIRDYNEDTITVTKVELNNNINTNLENNIINKEKNDFYFFAVYDGHGGKGCSIYLKENLHNNIKEFSKQGIKEAIEITEEKFKVEQALNEKGEISDSSGSCGVMAMIQNNKIIIANVGDSRLVLFKNGKVFFATEDHKPNTETEKKRIKNAGGEIYQTFTYFPLRQNGREIEAPWRVLPGRLSVSRTFGDVEAKDPKFGGIGGVVMALPDITEFDLDDEFNFMVIGCDGIFDVLSNEEILECVKIVLNEKKVEEINEDNIHDLCGDFAGMIVKGAIAKDSSDNVSCIVVAFNLKSLLTLIN